MTEQEARNLFMDYLYDEIDNQKKEAFEKFLIEHPALQKELDELTETRKILQFAPLETPDFKMVMMPQEDKNRKKTDHQKINSSFLRDLHPGVKNILAIAASILIILFGSSLAGLHIGQTGNGYYLTFGNVTPAQTEGGIGEEDVLNLINQIHEENTLMMKAMIEQTQVQQNAQLEETLAALTAYYDQRRQQDLVLIAEGFSQLEQDTFYRLRQTDETIGNILYALSNQ